MQQGPALLWLGQPLALLSQSLQVLGGLKVDTMPLTNKQSFYGDTLLFMLAKKKKKRKGKLETRCTFISHVSICIIMTACSLVHKASVDLFNFTLFFFFFF